MNNFKFKNPTELIFGEGMIKELPKRIPSDATILVTFGGGSARRNGIYDSIKETLSAYKFVEFWGIESNPKVETLRKAIAVGKENNCQFVLAVGGGSVIDGSKLIAAAIPYEGDAWDLVLQGYSKNKILPLGTILTIPATGSEMNSGAVISREETKEKLVFRGNHPVFSILDPQVTFSLPPYQIACGLADSFVHVMEQYMTTPGQSRLMDRWAESIMLTLIEIAPLIKENPKDYNLMADFMLSATMALNGFISMGVTQDWATHMIGHEITALTEVTHGNTLAIVLPGTLRILGHGHKREKMLQYAERVWNITSGNEDDRIDEAIKRTESFFRELGLKTRLSEMNIGKEVIDEIEKRFIERGVLFGEAQDVDGPMARRILEACQ